MKKCIECDEEVDQNSLIWLNLAQVQESVARVMEEACLDIPPRDKEDNVYYTDGGLPGDMLEQNDFVMLYCDECCLKMTMAYIEREATKWRL